MAIELEMETAGLRSGRFVLFKANPNCGKMGGTARTDETPNTTKN
jgi:hypothetical protein